MLLDTSGNLGLGVTPGIWTVGSAFQLGYAGSVWYDSTSALGNTRISNNIRFNSALQYLQTGAASYYQQGAGAHYWFSYASGSAGAALSGGAGQAMTLDASGRLLIGQTVDKTQEVLRVSGSGQASLLLDNTGKTNGAFVGAFNDAALLGVNRNPSTGTFYNTSNRATDIALVGSATDSYIIFETSTAANTTPTERARITSDGKLLVNATATATVLNKTIELSSAGTSTDQPSYLVNSYVAAGNAENCGYFTFNRSAGSTVGTNTLVANDDRLGMVRFSGANGTSYNAAAEIYAEIDGTPGASSDMPGRLIFATTPNGSASTTERARITSGGDFCVNTTAKVYEGLISVSFDGNGGSGDQGIALIDTNASLNGDYLLFVNSAGNVAGKITHNGTTTVAYTTSSDYRLKNTIAPITGALAKVALLKPCTYKWNVDGSDGQGFIAHELAEVVPDCVVGEKDAVDAEGKPRYQGVDTSFLVATLTAAIQELTARVAQLESK
jgi:hypothetical protein